MVVRDRSEGRTLTTRSSSTTIAHTHGPKGHSTLSVAKIGPGRLCGAEQELGATWRDDGKTAIGRADNREPSPGQQSVPAGPVHASVDDLLVHHSDVTKSISNAKEHRAQRGMLHPREEGARATRRAHRGVQPPSNLLIRAGIMIEPTRHPSEQGTPCQVFFFHKLTRGSASK